MPIFFFRPRFGYGLLICAAEYLMWQHQFNNNINTEAWLHLKMLRILSVLTFLILINDISCYLWCYSCVSSQPGCGEFGVDSRIHHTITCPREDDKCVKIIERKGVDKFITRDCLSNIETQKKDIPADRYDGCRSAAAQPKLAVYVENHMSQLEIKHEHWDETTYCFCDFDQWCNEGNVFKSNLILILCVLFIFYLFFN